MARPSFPNEEHRKYVERVASEAVATRQNLHLVKVRPSSPTDKFVYEVLIEASEREAIRILEVPYQMVECCIDQDSDQRLRAWLEGQFASLCFPTAP